MARKQRNDVDYFPHPVNHGKKMFYLRSKYENNGYAVWFMLLEQLGKTEYHYLDLKDDVQTMYLSAEFKVSELLLNEIIETLVKFDEFDSELWEEEKILFNNKFIENISDAYKKRSNDCIDKNSLVELLTSKGRLKRGKSNPKPSKSNIKGGGNPQRIVKDSKEKKSVEETPLAFNPLNQIEENKAQLKNKIELKEHYKFLKEESPTIYDVLKRSTVFEKVTKLPTQEQINLVDRFNSKCLEEDLPYDASKILGRFKGYAGSWITRTETNSKKGML